VSLSTVFDADMEYVTTSAPSPSPSPSSNTHWLPRKMVSDVPLRLPRQPAGQEAVQEAVELPVGVVRVAPVGRPDQFLVAPVDPAGLPQHAVADRPQESGERLGIWR
jgi:hypothetical protein